MDRKKRSHRKYGLTLPKYKLARAGFFVPLIIVACSGLIFGIKLNYGPLETVLFVISMCCVGFLEEILFRGFLFVGMAQKNVNSAVIVAYLTFGIGHIIYLLNGQDLVKTIFQIVFAIAVGFTLVTLFYKGKSLIPCIVFHGINNACGRRICKHKAVENMVHLSKIELSLTTKGKSSSSIEEVGVGGTPGFLRLWIK